MTWQVLLYPARLAVFSWTLCPPTAKWWSKEEEGVEERWWRWRWRRQRRGRKSRRSIRRVRILIPPICLSCSPADASLRFSLRRTTGKNNLPVHTLSKTALQLAALCASKLNRSPSETFFLLNYRMECFTVSNSIMANARYFFSNW